MRVSVPLRGYFFEIEAFIDDYEEQYEGFRPLTGIFF